MSERNFEQGYLEGSRAAWRAQLAECIRQLGYDELVTGIAKLIKEREDAVAALREICGTHGDNDWPDNLHLGDVIEKHLGRHLVNADHASSSAPTSRKNSEQPK